MVKMGITLHLCLCLPWGQAQVLEQACVRPCEWFTPLGSTAVPIFMVCRNSSL